MLGEGESHPKAPLLPLPQERGNERLSRLPVLATASSPSCICLSPSLLMGTVINRSFSLSPCLYSGPSILLKLVFEGKQASGLTYSSPVTSFSFKKLLHGPLPFFPYNHQTARTYVMILGHWLEVIGLPDHRWSLSPSLLSQL